MASLSYQQKSLYGSLAAELLVYGPYFLSHRQNSFNKVAGMITAIVVLQIILQSLIAIFTRHRLKDERDQLIELRGYRIGYLSLATMMVLGLGALWLSLTVGRMELNGRQLGLHFLSVLFGMLVIADITRTVAQIVAYQKAV